jgi:hypothetical protein
MDTAQYLARLVDQLVDGWRERVEFFIRISVHTPACLDERASLRPGTLRHHACRCPRRLEARAKTERQPALIAQLRDTAARAYPAGESGDPGVHSAPGSRPPASLAAADLLLEIVNEARAARTLLVGEGGEKGKVEDQLRSLVTYVMHSQEEYSVQHTVRTVRQLVSKARVLLDYEVPSRMLADVVCHECGGGLRVREDASSDVRCAGTPEAEACGTVYRRWEWAALLEQKQQQEAG